MDGSDVLGLPAPSSVLITQRGAFQQHAPFTALPELPWPDPLPSSHLLFSAHLLLSHIKLLIHSTNCWSINYARWNKVNILMHNRVGDERKKRRSQTVKTQNSLRFQMSSQERNCCTSRLQKAFHWAEGKRLQVAHKRELSHEHLMFLNTDSSCWGSKAEG